MSARVSVVIAVLDGARQLPDALASIRAQTHPAAEILLVDGGSTDGTREIADAAPDVRLVDQRGDTLADAYTTGVQEAAGTHIAFLAHDDLWLPRKTELQLELLAREPDAAAAVGHARFEVLPGETAPPGFRPELLGAAPPARIMETLLAPRETFARVGPFSADVSPADDVDWFLRAQDLGLRIAVVPDVILRKRLRAGSTAHTAPGMNAALLRSLHASIRRRGTVA